MRSNNKDLNIDLNRSKLLFNVLLDFQNEYLAIYFGDSNRYVNIDLKYLVGSPTTNF
jgi:hypothetical protein